MRRQNKRYYPNKSQRMLLSLYMFNFAEETEGLGSSAPNTGGEGTAPAEGTAASTVGNTAPATEGSTENQGGAGESKSWIDTLPEAIRGNEKLKNFKSLEDLAKAVLDVQAPPTEIKLPEGTPEAVGKWAVEKGLTQDQFDSVMKKHGEIIAEQSGQLLETHKAGTQELFKNWGESKDENLGLANRVVAYADPDGKLELIKFLKSPESGYAMVNPLVIKLFYNIGKSMKESGMLKNETPPLKANTTKATDMAYEQYPYLKPEGK